MSQAPKSESKEKDLIYEEKNEGINACMVKELTGNDEFHVRKLREHPKRNRPQCVVKNTL